VSIREESLRALDSEYRQAFLAELIKQLSFEGRGEYIEMGLSPEQSATGLRCFNEMVLATASQLSSGDLQPAYPNEAFLETLSEAATRSGFSGRLRRAAVRALEDTYRRGDR